MSGPNPYGWLPQFLNNFVGDSGSGGLAGLVPAPAAGDAAALKFLGANGQWGVPSGTGTVTNILGTTNQIDVTIAGTVYTISLDNSTNAVLPTNMQKNISQIGPVSLGDIVNMRIGFSSPAFGNFTTLSAQTSFQMPNITGGIAGIAHFGLTGIMSSSLIVAADVTNGTLTYNKLQNVASVSLLGNPTGSAAVVEEVTLDSSSLRFVGTTLKLASTIATGQYQSVVNSTSTSGNDTASMGYSVQQGAVSTNNWATLGFINGGSVLKALVGCQFTNASTGTADLVFFTSSPTFEESGRFIGTSNTLSLVNPLPAISGGTGNAIYAIGDIVQANSTTTLARLASVATGNALISGGVATVNSWGKIGLTTHISGILPYANGGTNASTSWTQGGIFLAGASAFVQDSSNFFWDAPNHRLGLGTASPVFQVDVRNTSSTTCNMSIGKWTGTPPTTFGTPYLKIGGMEFGASGLYTVGFAYQTTITDNPAIEIGAITVNSTGARGIYDFIIATSSTNSLSAAAVERFRITNDGYMQLSPTNFVANGSVATVLTSLGPTGASTTVRQWLQIKNSAGTVFSIPCF